MPGTVATLAAFGSFLAALTAIFLGAGRSTSTFDLWTWAAGPGFAIAPSLMTDGITIWMLAVVSGVSALIHLYSIGYMAGDPGVWRYFATINFFLGSMMLLVSAGSLVVLLAGWAGVGLASYLLIAHWFERPEAAAAGIKAFVVNAVGDAGLVLATALAVAFLGTDSYIPILEGQLSSLPSWVMTAIVLGLLLAALAKSAQVPLQVWLPDAMAGPTPVSALIHAATMVTAGVYLLVRFQPVLASLGWPSPLIVALGTLTLLLGSTAALPQTNLKRVLAYSTISQLGYMFVAAGAFSQTAALFHLTGHAFFKALLFLAGGMVIHALHGEEDMRHMGGLARPMAVAHWTFLIGCAGLAGLPPTIGFFSKDAVITAATHGGIGWALLALAGVFITAMYSFRMWFYVFLGPKRWQVEQFRMPSWTMTVPVVVIALATLLGGILESQINLFVGSAPREQAEGIGWIPLTGLVLAIGGLIAILLIYRRHPTEVRPAPEHGALLRLLAEGWGFDTAYRKVLVGTLLFAAAGLKITGELSLTSATVGSTSAVVDGLGRLVRKWQSGYLRPYILAAFVGVLMILAIVSYTR